MWRLALDAVAIYGAARYQPSRSEADAHDCVCGGRPVGRMHCFWHCPVALAVRLALQAALTAAGLGQQPLLPHHLLLAEPPAGVFKPAWRVVAAAALTSMDHGRRMLTARALQHAEAAPEDESGVVPPADLRCAAASAVRHVWTFIADFADLHAAKMPRGWQPGDVPAAHPFLAAHGGGRAGLRAVPPPPAADPDAAAAAAMPHAALAPAPPAPAGIG